MEVSPENPHFFKPILPGFKQGLKIPKGFLKYVKGHAGIAVLRRAGKKWLVKLKGRQFDDEGWGNFAEEHGLQLGDVLVFRHEGDMEFEVTIFDSTHCDREYAEYLQQQGEADHTIQETSKKFDFKDKPNAEAATRNPVTQSHFRLPKQFARANGLINKKCDLTVRDERHKSWNLRLTAYGSQVYIGGGWAEFRVSNELKVGDRIMFEVVTNGEKPIWKFHDKPKPSIKSSSKAFPHLAAATHKPFGHSSFVCTIRPYCFTYDFLYLPKQFAMANDLINKKCDLIIRDEWQKSWNLVLRPLGSGVCIRDGWNKFRDTNCLKEGDHIMFEVVTDGMKPIWKFHGRMSEEDASIGLTEQ